MIRTLGVLVAVGGVLVGCGCQTQTACTAEARPSLMINVVQAAGTPVCGAVVSVRDGSFSADVQEAPDRECTHGGVAERKGTYSIDVHYGTRRTTVDDVKVTADECHVHTRRVTVTLPA